MKKIALLLTICFLSTFANAQRYLTPVFDEVSTQYPVVYGSNYTVITLTVTGHTRKQPLVGRLYTPLGDTATNRPLIVMAHTGSFLPWINAQGQTVSGSCGGTIDDPGLVETCQRLAKMGYVVFNADYRQGWNPLATEEISRRAQLINAAYRGIQDVRTAARFFRRSVAEQNNPFGIDPNKFMIWGNGTGGYISLGAASLDDYNEILMTSEPGKFLLPGNIPMVIPTYNGDINGLPPGALTVCVSDVAYQAGTGIPAGDTLCISNHPGYSSDFQLALNMGGALGDKGWLDADTKPIISFHVPADPYAPCTDGIVIVPTTQGPVVNVTGSCGIQPIINSNGTNAVFHANWNYNDNGLTDFANTINGNASAFYPFLRPAADSAPWEWNEYVPIPLTCSTDKPKAMLVLDTAFAYATPRMCLALNLGACGVTGVETVNNNISIDVVPNPATSEVTFKSNDNMPIKAFEIYDVSGRMVRTELAINSTYYTFQRSGLGKGMYIAKLYFNEGVIAKKVIFE
jgi:hypothetical protein